MTTINEIFQSFGPEYLERFSHLMPNAHRKVIDAIIACRTEACGLALYKCEKCGEVHRVHRSCGNRHCPTCQYHKSRQWLEKQMKRQLPGHHFLLTFTVPESLRLFIRYRKPHSHRLRTIPLEVMEFIRRFLQHVLPTGLMKVRYYGFLNPSCAVSLDHIRSLIELSYGFDVPLPNIDLEPWQQITCPACGGTLRLRSVLLPVSVLLWSG